MFIVLCLISGVSASAARADALTLSSAVKSASDRSPDVRAAQARIREAEANLRAARLYGNPVADGEVARENSGNIEWSIGGRLPIDIGGQVSARTRAAAAGLRAARLESNDAERQVSATAARAYIKAALAFERTRIARSIVGLRGRLMTVAQERFGVGDASQLERNLAKAEVAAAEGRLRRLVGEEAGARAALAAALYVPPATPIDIGRDLSVEPPQGTFDVIVNRALARRGDLAALAQRAEAETHTAAALYASRWEGTSVGPRFAQQWDGNERENVVGVGFSVPLPILNRREGERDAARARAVALGEDASKLRREIVGDIDAAYARLTEAERTITLYRDEVVPLTEENAGKMEEAYRYRSVRASEVIQAEERYAAALDEYLEAVAGRADAAANLVAATGDSWISTVPFIPEAPRFELEPPDTLSTLSTSTIANESSLISEAAPSDTSRIARHRLPVAVSHEANGDSGARRYLVRPGDTLFRIAANEIGDAKRWMEIADKNGLFPPYVLRAGQVIALPERSSGK